MTKIGEEKHLIPLLSITFGFPVTFNFPSGDIKMIH